MFTLEQGPPHPRAVTLYVVPEHLAGGAGNGLLFAAIGSGSFLWDGAKPLSTVGLVRVFKDIQLSAKIATLGNDLAAEMHRIHTTEQIGVEDHG